jgi:hypothetical protein
MRRELQHAAMGRCYTVGFTRRGERESRRLIRWALRSIDKERLRVPARHA